MKTTEIMLELFSSILLLGFSENAHSEIKDMMTLALAPMAVVWSTDRNSEKQLAQSNPPVTSDYTLLANGSKSDSNTIISGQDLPVITGILEHSHDSSEALAAHQPPLNKVPANYLDLYAKAKFHDEIKNNFYVSSNVPFKISAQRDESLLTHIEIAAKYAEPVNMKVEMTAQGQEQDLYFGNKTQATNENMSNQFIVLGALSDSVKVYSTRTKTAKAEGTVVEQSVKFEMTYTFNESHASKIGDFSSIIPIIYTVYSP